MIRIFTKAKQVAPYPTTILLLGDTGVGKEVISTFIYRNSDRAGKPFIKINCSAIPEPLMESELFGYEKGAFTGARDKGKMGLFELANHGTILLDEIGDMSLPLQAKLLRTLQENEIMRVGGSQPIKLDVRLIAATSRNIEEMVAGGATSWTPCIIAECGGAADPAPCGSGRRTSSLWLSFICSILRKVQAEQGICSRTCGPASGNTGGRAMCGSCGTQWKI